MEKNVNKSDSLKALQTKENVSKVAAKLKDKVLFPDKLEKAKEFFRQLETKTA